MVHMEVVQHYLNLDWAERMAVLVDNEAMSLHWTQKAVGILVGVHIRHAHTSDDGVGHIDDAPKLWKRHVFWITDVMDRGHQPVMSARYMLWEYERKNGITVLDWEEWSDGCAEQFRCMCGLMDFVEAIKKDSVRSVSKNFYCPYHGKTEGDGAGGWMKCTCQMASIHEDEYLPDAAHVYSFMNQQKYTEPKFSSYKSGNEKRTVNEKLYFLITQADVDKVAKLNGKTMKCGIKKTDRYKLRSKP